MFANWPSLVRYFPDWLIRDWSLRFARQWQWAIEKLHDVPFAAAQAEHVSRLNAVERLRTSYIIDQSTNLSSVTQRAFFNQHISCTPITTAA